MKTSCFTVFQGPGRICIARYAPRGTPAGFKMFQKLAPGPWFNKVPEDEYRRRYFGEILEPLDPRQVLAELEELAGGAEPVLLCWEKPPLTTKNWCHRSMVAEWFAARLGIEVPELVVPRATPATRAAAPKAAIPKPVSPKADPPKSGASARRQLDIPFKK